MRAILGILIIIMIVWAFIISSGLAGRTYGQMKKNGKKFDDQIKKEDGKENEN